MSEFENPYIVATLANNAGAVNVNNLTITVDYAPYTDYAMIILKTPDSDFPENIDFFVNYLVIENI